MGSEASEIIRFISLTVISMGFVMVLALAGFGWLLARILLPRNRGAADAAAAIRAMADPAPGRLLVTGATIPIHSSLFQNCEIVGLLSANGMQPVATRFHGIVETRKIPKPDQVLPVMVDRKHPGSFAIEWDKVATGSDEAMLKAQAMAQASEPNDGSPSPWRGGGADRGRTGRVPLGPR